MSPGRLLAAFILLLSFGWTISIWISAGMVQWVSTQTEHRLDISSAERRALVDRLLRIANVTPASPLLLETLVRLDPNPENKLMFLNELLSLRPGDSEALASVFSIRLGLGLNDETTEAVLEKSLLVGGWEPGALKIIVDAGTYYWLALSSESRGLVLEAARRQLTTPHRWRIDEVIGILRSRGFLRITCAAIAAHQLSAPPDYCLSYR